MNTEHLCMNRQFSLFLMPGNTKDKEQKSQLSGVFQTLVGADRSYLSLRVVEHFLVCHRGYKAKMVTLGRLDVHDVWAGQPEPLPLDGWSEAAVGQWNAPQRRRRRWRWWWWWGWRRWRGRGKSGGTGERCFPQRDTQKEVMEAPQQEIGQYSQGARIFFCLHSESPKCCSILLFNSKPPSPDPKVSYSGFQKHCGFNTLPPAAVSRLREFSRDLGVESWKCHSACFKLAPDPLSPPPAPQAL